MSGVTNRTMRALYKPFGFGLTVTEFVSSNALQYGNARTMEMIDQHGVERPVSTQLWGNDPAIMALAAKVVRECGADIVDINFGCPAPKVTKTEGGSACLGAFLRRRLLQQSHQPRASYAQIAAYPPELLQGRSQAQSLLDFRRI